MVKVHDVVKNRQIGTPSILRPHPFVEIFQIGHT